MVKRDEIFFQVLEESKPAAHLKSGAPQKVDPQ
jgi:hypothetical protein